MDGVYSALTYFQQRGLLSTSIMAPKPKVYKAGKYPIVMTLMLMTLLPASASAKGAVQDHIQANPEITIGSRPFYSRAFNAIVTSIRCRSIGIDCPIQWVAIKGTRAKAINATSTEESRENVTTRIDSYSTPMGCESLLYLSVALNVTRDEVPDFLCTAGGRSSESSFHPKIAIPIRATTSTVRAIQGENTTIRCPFQEDLPKELTKQLKAHWTAPEMANVSLSYDLDLFIEEVTAEIGGVYNCNVFGAGNVQTPRNSSTVHVIVIVPPSSPKNLRFGPNSTCSHGWLLQWDPPEEPILLVEVNSSADGNITTHSANTTQVPVRHPRGLYTVRFKNDAGLGEPASVEPCWGKGRYWVLPTGILVALVVAGVLIFLAWRLGVIGRLAGCCMFLRDKALPCMKIRATQPSTAERVDDVKEICHSILTTCQQNGKMASEALAVATDGLNPVCSLSRTDESRVTSTHLLLHCKPPMDALSDRRDASGEDGGGGGRKDSPV
eukprot:m.306242 g.306242  ORF g.306242 m.306242 type:complete len:496 (+) comp41081_c0_seq1:61-1548(+)